MKQCSDSTSGVSVNAAWCSDKTQDGFIRLDLNRPGNAARNNTLSSIEIALVMSIRFATFGISPSAVPGPSTTSS